VAEPGGDCVRRFCYRKEEILKKFAKHEKEPRMARMGADSPTTGAVKLWHVTQKTEAMGVQIRKLGRNHGLHGWTRMNAATSGGGFCTDDGDSWGDTDAS
jgi:hypothetical protein